MAPGFNAGRGPTSLASTSATEVRALPGSSFPFTPPFHPPLCTPGFALPQTTLPPSPSCMPVSHPFISHSRWHCVCTGLGRDPKYFAHLFGFILTTRYTLPPTHSRSPGFVRMPHFTPHLTPPFPHTALQRPGLRTGVRSGYLFRIQSGFANSGLAHRTGVNPVSDSSWVSPDGW